MCLNRFRFLCRWRLCCRVSHSQVAVPKLKSHMGERRESLPKSSNIFMFTSVLSSEKMSLTFVFVVEG